MRHLIFTFLLLLAFGSAQAQRTFIGVPKGTKQVTIEVDSATAVKHLKKVLFDAGLMVEIDKDGYFKTTNSAQVSVLLVFLSGQITYQDTIATIIMQGMVDDSFFTNVAMGVLANSSGGKSFSQLKLQKQNRGDVFYRAFCKMLQIAQQVGPVKWQDNGSATLVKIYPEDIARD